MKKITLSLLFILLCVFVYAQNGLEGIIVEKYYVSDANDSTVNDGIAAMPGRLPSGSVTWRIYVDLLQGYNFQVAYGSPTHELRIESTTNFFNNEDRGSSTPSYAKTYAKSNTVMLDSWLSAGAACLSNFGILKSLDNGVSTVVNQDGALQNTDPSAGIPVKTQDGLIAGSPGSVTFVGLTTEQDVFGDGTTWGNSFVTSNGAWSCLSGAKGPDTVDNKVLIAQLTTNGKLHFKLNIQIGDPDGSTQNYVADSPTGNEIFMQGLNFYSDSFSVAVPGVKVEEVNFSVSPNPSSEVVTLELNAKEASKTSSYALYDINGQVVCKKNLGALPSGLHRESVNVSSLACGEYLLEVTMDGVTKAKKIIKN